MTAALLGEKRGAAVGPSNRGKEKRWMVVVDGQGIPLGSTIASASPHEVTLVDKVLAQIKVPRNGPGRPKSNPKRLIGDRAYDSDKLRKDLRNRQIELICPHRKNRKKPKVQDGRKLRRYRKRWKIERTFSWISNYRRLVVRYERRITVYQAFFHIACILITLKQF